MRKWARHPHPITAACHLEGRLHIRLSGAQSNVERAVAELGGESGDETIWPSLNDHQHPYFRREGVLWRLSVAPAAPVGDEGLIEWGGAQRWMYSDASDASVHDLAARMGGHARRQDERPRFDDALSLALKQAFDPRGILNRGDAHAD